MKLVEVIVADGVLKVNSPYYPPFLQKTRDWNGKWDGMYWKFDARLESEVRRGLLDLYGEDGYDPAPPRATCRVELDEWGGGSELSLLGRVLCQRPSCNAPVELGDQVLVAAGGFPDTGGSVRHPRVNSYTGTVLTVFDVPLDLARRTAELQDWVSFKEPLVRQAAKEFEKLLLFCPKCGQETGQHECATFCCRKECGWRFETGLCGIGCEMTPEEITAVVMRYVEYKGNELWSESIKVAVRWATAYARSKEDER